MRAARLLHRLVSAENTHKQQQLQEQWRGRLLPLTSESPPNNSTLVLLSDGSDSKNLGFSQYSPTRPLLLPLVALILAHPRASANSSFTH